MSSVFRSANDGGMSGSVEQTPGKLSVARVLQKRKNSYDERRLPTPPYPTDGLVLWFDPSVGERNMEWYGLEREQGRVTKLTNLVNNDKYVPLPWNLRWAVEEATVGEPPYSIYLPGSWTTDTQATKDAAIVATASGSTGGFQITTTDTENHYGWSVGSCNVAKATRTAATVARSILARVGHVALGGETAADGIALVNSGAPESNAVRFEITNVGTPRAIVMSEDAEIAAQQDIACNVGTGPIWLKVSNDGGAATFSLSEDGIDWDNKLSLPTSGLLDGYYLYLTTAEPELLDEVEFTDVLTGDDYAGSPSQGLGTYIDEEGLIFDPPFDNSYKVESRTLFGRNPFFGKLTSSVSYADHDVFIVQTDGKNGEDTNNNCQLLVFQSGSSFPSYQGKMKVSWMPQGISPIGAGMFLGSTAVASITASYFSGPIIFNECFKGDALYPPTTGGVCDVSGSVTSSVYDGSVCLFSNVAGVARFAPSLAYATNMVIGGSTKTNLYACTNAAFSGALYEVIVYDRKLSDDERASVIATIRSRRTILTGTVR